MARCLRRRARFASNSPPRSGLLAQRVSFAAVVCLSMLLTGCADPGSDAVVLTADLPLHLEDHLDVATIEGSEIPTDVPEPVEWRFDEPQPGWKLAEPWTPTVPTIDAASLAYTDDALRMVLLQRLGSRARVRWVDLATRPIRTPCGSAASDRPRRPSPSTAPAPCGAHALSRYRGRSATPW